MKVKLAFGREGAAIALPAHVRATVLAAKFAEAVASADDALAEALRHPLGAPALLDMARGKRTAAIAICDITRPAPNRRPAHSANAPPSTAPTLALARVTPSQNSPSRRSRRP